MNNKKEKIELLETIEIPVEKIKHLIDVPKEEIELLQTIEIPISEIKKANRINVQGPIELLETIKIPIEEIQEQLTKLPQDTITYNEIEIPTNKIREIFKKARKKYLFIGNKKICRKIWIVILFVAIICITLLTYILFNWNKDNNNLDKEIKKIQSIVQIEEVIIPPQEAPPITTTTPSPTLETEIITEPSPTPTLEANPYWDFMYIPFINVNLEELKQENLDTVGWIKVPNTKINYPFVQTIDNEYYLNHSFYKKKNSAGWVFLDYRNNFQTLDKNNILYAHGRLNNTMFGSLKKVIEPEWYQEQNNRYIQISSIYSNTVWEVFSVYTIKPENYYLKTKFNTDEDFQNFYQELKNRSVTNFNTEINPTDKILTLSSCYNDELRVVLHAKLNTITEK